MDTAEHARTDLARAELLELIPGLELITARALGSGDDARDAVQEVLARAVAALERGRELSGSLAAFVHGIAMHVIADVYRARGRTIASSPDIDAAHSNETGALESLIDAEERRVLASALARLDPDDRELLRRCFVDGEQIAAIARETGEPADRIRKRKSRALQHVRRLLRDNPNGHVPSQPPTKNT